jgi:hypothetical protein
MPHDDSNRRSDIVWGYRGIAHYINAETERQAEYLAETGRIRIGRVGRSVFARCSELDEDLRTEPPP